MGFNIAKTNKKRGVIIGGGVGGVKLANKLKGSNLQVGLIDKNNFHQFPPLLYQVASSGLAPGSIIFPFRKIFQKQKDFYFRMAEVKAIIAERNLIETSIGELTYDYLVIASGTITNFFGNKTIEEKALPMKTIQEALELRNTLLSNFEKATICTDPEERQALMNVVIVGGGATGVEISGVLAEMKRFVMPKDYPDLKQSDMHIYLVEGSPRLLGVMSPEASANAEKFLKGMGVNIILNKRVTDYQDGKVILDDNSTIATQTLVWVSGVTATHFEHIDKEALNRGGRITVNEFNQMPGMANVFAIPISDCIQLSTFFTFSLAAAGGTRLRRACGQSVRRGLSSSCPRRTNGTALDPAPLSTVFRCSPAAAFSACEKVLLRRSSVRERSRLCCIHGRPARPRRSKGQCRLLKWLAGLSLVAYP